LAGLSGDSIDFNQALETDTHHAVSSTRGTAHGCLSGDFDASFEKGCGQIRVVGDTYLLSVKLNDNLG
jgi:hypothetical protein